MALPKGSSIMTIRHTYHGFALPTVIMALVILAVLITGAIYMAQQEYRVGWSADQSSVAFNMTERSVVEVVTNWDAARYSVLPAWGSADTTGALADGTWSATITKMTDFFYFVDVTGVVSRGGPLRAGASHEVGVIVHVTSASLSPPAALTTRGDITVRGNAEVIGQDVDPPLWGMCTEPPQDKPGLATDLTSTVTTQGQGTITGSPPVLQDPSIADSTFTEFGNVDWDEMILMADLRPPSGSLNIAPSLNGNGTCNTDDVENWGHPESPGHACENYFPIIFVNGDARIQSGGVAKGFQNPTNGHQRVSVWMHRTQYGSQHGEPILIN